jgi:XTP/dITP diphosphohydrolase
MILYASTKNKGKLSEFLECSEQVARGQFQIEALPGIADITLPDETGHTFEENAALKASYYSRFVHGYVFADDSGLEVDALEGAPGVRSARYAGEHAADEENNALLLLNLATVSDRSARFTCAISLARAGQLLHTTRAHVKGEILTGPRGQNGFGYDPLFYYPPFGRTFAELDQDQKFQVSHRGKAFRALLEWLSTPPQIG